MHTVARRAASYMSGTLQERHNIQGSLQQLQVARERSEDRYRTYADLQHQLEILNNQVFAQRLMVMHQSKRCSLPMIQPLTGQYLQRHDKGKGWHKRPDQVYRSGSGQ